MACNDMRVAVFPSRFVDGDVELWYDLRNHRYDLKYVVEYLRHEEEPVEIGYASSYGEASRLVREWAARPARVKDVSYFRIEGRYYV